MADKKRMQMVPVKVIVIDVLKPHKPSILELGKEICKHKHYKGVRHVWVKYFWGTRRGQISEGRI